MNYLRSTSIFTRGHWTEPTTGLDPRVLFVVCPQCIVPQQVMVPVSEPVNGEVVRDVSCGHCGRHDPGATLTGLDFVETP